jgi:integrase
MTIKDIIKRNRPNLSVTSIRSYGSNILNLAKKVDIEINNKDDVVKHLNKIMTYLKDNLPANKRKTYLASLVVLFDGDKDDMKTVEHIRSLMLKDIKQTKDEDEKMEMSENQKDNWMDWTDILERYNGLEKSIQHLYKLEKLNKEQLKQLQMYTILSLYTLIPPRRSLDYIELKFRNIDKAEDNYITKDEIVFNKYKTAKIYGETKVKIPKKLKTILDKFIKFRGELNDKEYLFFDNNGNKLNQTKLNNILVNFFDKKIGPSMLRHIYLSHYLKNVPQGVFETAKDMGHSVEQAIKYKKK